jgi:hypothetical protein
MRLPVAQENVPLAHQLLCIGDAANLTRREIATGGKICSECYFSLFRRF